MMKRIAYALLLTGLLVACRSHVAGGRKPAKAADPAGNLEWLSHWIGAWEQMAGNVLK
ncbi:MAG: hypothetical protein ICV83_16335, partial [Cytophagales bacterium]|nr:hypothetical protein [Cytophagales bacterium]